MHMYMCVREVVLHMYMYTYTQTNKLCVRP